MTTTVKVRACGNPRTAVTVEIHDHAADRDDTVQTISLAPGQEGEYHATTSRSIFVKEASVAA